MKTPPEKSAPHPRARADSYFGLLDRAPPAARERRAAYPDAPPCSERALKCVWYDRSFRPPALHTDLGEEVLVESPGAWNLEAGPDFLGATLTVGRNQRRLCGDVEIHIHPSDWNAHGHKNNPAYSNVIAHVCYFKGRLPAENLPAGALQIAMAPDLSANPFFCFDSIDLSAYPFSVQSQPTPCSLTISRWDPARVRAFLEAAGHARLENKTQRMAKQVGIDGEQALYEETMGALGYKHNRAPFRRLARLVPVSLLREESGLDPLTAYALLAGAAGLLPAQFSQKWDRETKTWVRKVWDAWWKHNSAWAGREMSRSEWRLSGLRPQNHPARRIMAAAGLFCAERQFSERVKSVDIHAANAVEQFTALLATGAAGAAYWPHRLALGGRPTRSQSALVGETRAAAIVLNVIAPFLAASGVELCASLLDKIPPEQDNAVIRRAALALLGPDHNPAVYSAGIYKQGLIQVFQDFCMNDDSACASCPLPQALARFDAAPA